MNWKPVFYVVALLSGMFVPNLIGDLAFKWTERRRRARATHYNCFCVCGNCCKGHLGSMMVVERKGEP